MHGQKNIKNAQKRLSSWQT